MREWCGSAGVEASAAEGPQGQEQMLRYPHGRFREGSGKAQRGLTSWQMQAVSSMSSKARGMLVASAAPASCQALGEAHLHLFDTHMGAESHATSRTRARAGSGPAERGRSD